MVFATDLDRTIIYSKRFIEKYTPAVMPVEVHLGKEIAYMTKKAVENLKRISKLIDIIPVTTRNIGEYHRVALFKEIHPRYCIMNNGATIYVDGNEDEEWTKQVRKKIGSMNVGYNDIITQFVKKAKMEHVKVYRLSDDFLWVIVVYEELFDFSVLEQFKEYAKERGWNVVATGKKVYLIPCFINKWNALQHICNKYEVETVIAAGDSLLDYEMVINAAMGIVPRHGELAGFLNGRGIITQKSGIEAGEEILEIVASSISA